MNKSITQKNFKNQIINSTGITVLQFKTGWNGACQIISPIYNELAEKYKGHAGFFTVDTDRQKTIASEFGITELPTILFLKQGQVIDYITGLVPRNVLVTKIENAINDFKK